MEPINEENVLKGVRLFTDPKCKVYDIHSIVSNFTNEQKKDFLKIKLTEQELKEVLKRMEAPQYTKNTALQGIQPVTQPVNPKLRYILRFLSNTNIGYWYKVLSLQD